MEDHEKIRRSSIASLIGALALSSPFYLYLAFLFALSAMDSGTGVLVFTFGAAAVGWLILAAYIVRKWRRGWTSLWKIPLLVLMACLFWPALFLLFNQSIRRALLPGRPSQAAAYCAACGSSLPADAMYCPSCGATRTQVARV